MQPPFMTEFGVQLQTPRPAEEVIAIVLELAQRPRLTETRVVKKGLLGRREERTEVPAGSSFRFSLHPSDYGWQHSEEQHGSAVELNMWVLEFESGETLLILTPHDPSQGLTDYRQVDRSIEKRELAKKVRERLGAAVELSVEDVQALANQPHRLVCPAAKGDSALRYLTLQDGGYRAQPPSPFVTRDASALGIDRHAIWRSDRVAIEAVRDLRDAETRAAATDDEMPERNPWGVIVASGAGIVSAPSLLVAALAVNGSRRVLAVAEETETLQRRQLRDRNVIEWATSGGDRGKVYPVWIFRDDLEPTRVEASGDVKSMDVSPDGSLIALLEWANDPVLAVIEVSSGVRRVVKEFPERQFTQRIARLYGDERVAFSPDGAWILVSGDMGGPAVLVEVASGAVVDVPLADDRGATWWPHAGASMLLLWNWNREMDTELASFDLATLVRTPLGAIRIPETPGLNYERRVLSDFSVSPDGRSLLCTAFLGPPAEHQEEHASSPRWAVASLISDDPRYAAEITEVAPWALNGDPTQELTHRAVQWTGKGPEQPVTLHPSLLGRPA